MKNNLSLRETYLFMDSYDKDLTYFEVGVDIFNHASQKLPVSAAKDKLLHIDYYWHNEDVNTTYTVWDQSVLPVWTDNLKWEDKLVVIIRANNSELSKFALEMNTIND